MTAEYLIENDLVPIQCRGMLVYKNVPKVVLARSAKPVNLACECFIIYIEKVDITVSYSYNVLQFELQFLKDALSLASDCEIEFMASRN